MSPDALTPAREVFRNFGTSAVALFYFLGALAMVLFCYGAWARIRSVSGPRFAPSGGSIRTSGPPL